MGNWERVFAFVLAVVMVVVARRARALNPSGTVAALTVGTICAAAGIDWAALLLLFFVSANVLSHYRRGIRAARIDDVVEKGNERDAWQVLANGGVFAAAAALSMVSPAPLWTAIGAGAIAAVTSDTWSTEIGTVVDQSPRLLTNWKTVPPGTSGAVSTAGSLAAIAGALAMAAATFIAGWGARAALAAIIGGMAGSLIDSVLGATIQRHRWCERCERLTERLVHRCGTTTVQRGGVSWIGNDAVNAVAALGGAIAGVIVAL